MSGLPSSITHGANLTEISEAISRASRVTPLHYVERRGELYRWSPAHRGGPYPLLRSVAKLLGIDHHTVVLPFETLHDFCVVSRGEGEVQGQAWTILEFAQPAPPDEVRRRIVATFFN